MVDVTFALGRTFYEKLAAADDFVPLHEPADATSWSSATCRPDYATLPANASVTFQLELRRRIIESGEFYIVPIKRDGAGALRVTIINPLTTADHLDQLMDAMRRHGRELLQG